MQIAELEQYLGLPPKSPSLDKYLTAHGVAERPVFKETPIELVNIPEKGVSLAFREKLGYERQWGPAREDGDMVFASMQVFNEEGEDGFARFAGDLPMGLRFSTTLKDAIAKFGEATTDHESGDEHVYLWHDAQGSGWTVVLGFFPNNRGISFISLEKAKLKAPRKSRG